MIKDSVYHTFIDIFRLRSAHITQNKEDLCCYDQETCPVHPGI